MKTQSQENFPVATLLFNKRDRKTVTDYYNFARYCDDIADSSSLLPSEKMQLLDEAEQSLYGKGKIICAQKIREDFLAEKLDFSLATDLLQAFRKDAQNDTYQTWAQLLDYCQYSAAPVGRFILALFNENPSTYMPANALCTVLQIVNHVQDLRDDIIKLNRCYLPQELLNKYKISAKSLQKAKCSKNLHFLINDVLKRCDALLKDAKVLPSIVKSPRLRFYLCIVIALTNILIKKLYNKDILATHVTLSTRDRIRAVCWGCWQALTIRRKTLS